MVLPHPAINHREVNRLALGQELLVADHSACRRSHLAAGRRGIERRASLVSIAERREFRRVTLPPSDPAISLDAYSHPGPFTYNIGRSLE